jgi:hypothetical protein
MEKGDILFLNQLVKALEDTELTLEKAYKNNDSNRFNESKKFMIQIHRQISEILR